MYEDDNGDGISHDKGWDDEPTPITYDTYIGAEVVLPKGNDMVTGTVMSGVKEVQGQPIGKADKNPILFTMLNSHMVRMQNWEQVSLQSACMHNGTLKVTNTSLWIILLTIEWVTTWFAKITKMLQ